ncbi:MAG TPA: RcnB family protein [Steroidobacteraceae bacterium]|nr:RcnB family protein [Steroidobacteraceae bacterium]
MHGTSKPRLGAVSSGCSLALSAALLAAGSSSVALAQPDREHGGQHAAPARAAPRGEPHQGPQGYQRVTAPHGWNQRPQTVDRGAYQHNFRAARSYSIGPWRPPHGWVARRWVYGQILPRAYWAAPYLIGDYWLFALEVPPVGYEWVRDGNDALLVNMTTGEILQVEYGVFA